MGGNVNIVSVENNQAALSGQFISKFIGDITREEWKDGRKKYLGGSESFALVADSIGCSYKWDTPYTLFCKKSLGINLVKTNSDMLRGIERESQIMQELRDMGHEVYSVPYLFTDKEFDFLAANIDGVEKEGQEVFGIEIKSVRTFDGWSHGVPDNYYNQCQHYMMILGTQKHRIIADCNAEKKIVDIARHDQYIGLLKEKCIEFWENNVVQGIAPQLAYCDIEKAYVDFLNKDFEEGFLDIPEEQELAREYLMLKEKEKEIKESVDALSLRIKSLIGNKQGAFFGDIKANYIRVEKDSFDMEKFKEDHPDLFAAYIKKSSFTQLRVK